MTSTSDINLFSLEETDINYFTKVENTSEEVALRSSDFAGKAQKPELPAFKEKDEFTKLLDKHSVILVQSGTGSGKTAVLPLVALQWTINNNHKSISYKKNEISNTSALTPEHPNILVTMPKTVLTKSSAEYAARCLGASLGTDVGYAYRGSDETFRQPTQMLRYLTDGLLISSLSSSDLNGTKVIFIDEAHERKVNIDVLIFMLLPLLRNNDEDIGIRLVIMSATIDIQKYRKYFVKASNLDKSMIGEMSLNTKPNHKVTEHFLKEENKQPLPLIATQKVIEILKTFSNQD